LTSDLKKLDSRQTDTAIDLYRNELDDAIVRQDLLKDPVVRELNANKIKDAQKRLDELKHRKIELSK
jgi:hypothetical protein